MEGRRAGGSRERSLSRDRGSDSDGGRLSESSRVSFDLTPSDLEDGAGGYICSNVREIQHICMAKLVLHSV